MPLRSSQARSQSHDGSSDYIPVPSTLVRVVEYRETFRLFLIQPLKDKAGHALQTYRLCSFQSLVSSYNLEYAVNVIEQHRASLKELGVVRDGLFQALQIFLDYLTRVAVLAIINLRNLNIRHATRCGCLNVICCTSIGEGRFGRARRKTALAVALLTIDFRFLAHKSSLKFDTKLHFFSEISKFSAKNHAKKK